MIDALFQIGLSNVCLSLALAMVAMVVGAKTRRPQLAHLLWLLVFVKLVTPPLVSVPVVTLARGPETIAVSNDPLRTELLPTGDQGLDVSRPDLSVANSRESSVHPQPDTSRATRIGAIVWQYGRAWFAPIWLLGSLLVLIVSMVRVCRFSRVLAAQSDPAPQAVQAVAERTARLLGLKTLPVICTTSARVSPLVWWAGGRVRLIIPAALLDHMDAHQWPWVLAHELAHVRRRDYLVRWLEWLACVIFWWNPVVWWAQRNLRAMEEICCDDLVMSCLNPTPKIYANSLLSAVEFLARPLLRPPAMASEINSGGFLERRFKMIVSNRPKRSHCQLFKALILGWAVLVLPLGLAVAQDFEALERRLGEGVAKGELSLSQAALMLDALRGNQAQNTAGKAGKLSESQAHAKLKRAEAEMYRKVAEAELMELRAALQAGELSEEEARMREMQLRAEAEFKQLEAELHAGVVSGDLSEQEAQAKLRHAEAEMTAKSAQAELARLSEAVEAGEISEVGARAREIRLKAEIEFKRFEAEVFMHLANPRKVQVKRKAAKKDQDTDRAKAYLMKVKQELGAAVEAGEISRKDAAKRFEGAQKAAQENRAAKQVKRSSSRVSFEDYRRAEAKMKQMVEEGKAKPEDVERRLVEMRKLIRDKSRRGDRERPDWEAIKKRIEGAVKSGDITRAEAEAKYQEIRKRVAADRDRDHGEDEYEGLVRRIKAAVERGNLTREEAGEKIKAYRQRMAQARDTKALNKQPDDDGLAKRLEAAVKAGKLTEEEAKAKWMEIKKKAAAKDDE